MGKRLGRKWDLLTGGSGALLVLFLCFMLGGVVGCLFAGVTSGDGAQALSGYLSDYLSLALEGTVLRNLPLTVWEQLRWLVVAVVLGATVFGVVCLPVLFVVRGFLYAFSVGCFFRVFGGAGLFPAFVLFGLPALLWAPAIFLTGCFLFTRALTVGCRGELRGELGSAFVPRAGLSLLLVAVCGLLEYFCAPALLRAAARIVL